MKDWLRLARVPFVFTAISNTVVMLILSMAFFDIYAIKPDGVAAADWAFRWELKPLHWAIAILVPASFYLAGMILNDVADAATEAVSAPDKPLPSGRVSEAKARTIGFVLVSLPVMTIWWTLGPMALLVSASVASLILLYNFLMKPLVLAGSISMAGIRGCNALLGAVIVSPWLKNLGVEAWIYPGVLFAYVLGLTLVSTCEDDGGRRGRFLVSGAIMAAAPIAVFPFLDATGQTMIIATSAFLGLVVLRNWLNFSVERAKGMVLTGMFGFYLLDGAVLLGLGIHWIWGTAVLACIPVSWILMKSLRYVPTSP